MATTSSPDKVELYSNSKSKVYIRKSLVEVKGTEYPISNIYSFKIEKKNKPGEPPTIVLNIVVVSLIVIIASMVLELPQIIFPGLVFVVLMLLILIPPEEPNYTVTLITTKDQEIVLKPKDGSDMKKIKSALEKAMGSIDVDVQGSIDVDM
jgi:Family of unknown function (DUF6232)